MGAAEALQEVLASPAGATIAAGLLEGVGSAFGAIVAKTTIRRALGSPETRALADVTVLALARATTEAVAVEPLDWRKWWLDSGERILAVFSEPQVVRLVARAALMPGAEGLTLATLQAELPDSAPRLRELDGIHGVDVEELVRLLPSTLVDVLAGTASQPDSPLRDLWEAVALRRLVEAVPAEQVNRLSPAEVREQLRDFVEQVEKWVTGRLTSLPYLPRGVDPGRLDQAVRVRVGLRKGRVADQDAPDGTNSDGRYVPSAGKVGMGRESIGWDDAVRDNGYLVVLGDPGLGKTWLLQNHARRLAMACRRELDDGALASEVVVPLVVRCDALAATGLISLSDAAIEVVGGRHELTPGFRRWLREHARTGPVVLLLDALDETTQADRGTLAAQLELWSSNRPSTTSAASLVITSRITGYEEAPLPPGWAEVELEPFRPEDVPRYVDAWGLPDAARERLDERLGDPAIAGLARIPFLLAMLCDLAAADTALPATRAGLYDQILRRFLRAEHHRPEQAVHATRPLWAPSRQTEQRLLPVLRSVAAHFATTPTGWVDRMGSEEVLAALRAAPTFDELGADAPEVLEWLSVGTGILLAAGDSRRGEDPPYLFLHRTFAEYLTAAHLAGTDGAWQAAVAAHLRFDPDWGQVVSLLGGLLPRPEELLELLLAQQKDPLHHALLTSAQVLAELDPEVARRLAPVAEKVARRLYALITTPARLQAFLGLSQMSTMLPPAVVTALQTALTHNDHEASQDAARVLAGRPGQSVTTALMTTLAESADPEVRVGAARALAGRPGQAVTTALLVALPDNDPYVRREVAQALAGRPGQGVTTALVTALADVESDLEVREGAVEALAGRSGEDVTIALGRALTDDPDSRVRSAICQALVGRPGDAVTAALTSALKDSDPFIRSGATRALAGRPGQAVTTVLTAALTANDDPRVRWGAAPALASRPGKAVTIALTTALTDRDKHVRRGAVWALRGREGDPVTTALIAALTDNDPFVRKGAASALAGRSGPDVTAALARALTDDDVDVRRDAIDALTGRPGDPATTVLVAALTGDDSSSVRQRAARALAGRPGQTVTTVLVASLTDDDDSDVRWEAVKALACRPDQAVTSALIRSLGDDDSRVRSAAATALATRSGAAVTPALMRALAEDDPEVRSAAALALERRPGQAVTTALMTALGDAEAVVRSGAVQALASRPDLSVTPALMTALTDDDLEVRCEAVSALAGRPGQTVTLALTATLTGDLSWAVCRRAAEALRGRPGEVVTHALTSLLSHDGDPGVQWTALKAFSERPAEELAASIRAVNFRHFDDGARHLYSECPAIVKELRTRTAIERSCVLEAIAELTARVAPLPE